jgi:two-component system, OmpR family, sensor kinase
LMWHKRRDVFMSQVLPSLIVLIAFLVVTTFSWSTSRKNVQDLSVTTLAQKNRDTSNFISQRVSTYEDILRGEVGLFSINDKVNRQSWSTYLAQYDISGRYPGIYALGYIAVIKPGELDAHQQQVRAEGFTDYTVFPTGDRQLYTSILYIDPLNDTSSKGLGYDMYTEPVRRATMDKATDEGKAVLSNPVTLIQDKDSQIKQPGFLMFMPVYRNGSKHESVEDRRTNLSGFVTVAFRSNDLMQHLLTLTKEPYAFEITNIAGSSHESIYKSVDYEKSKLASSGKSTTTDIILPGTRWQIEATAGANLIDSTYRSRPTIIFWGGSLLSFIVAALIYLLLANRARTLAKEEEASIQEVKDDLLALASHQLRTPATGVKQYVGILREGLAGKVTPLQQSLLDKAHESNERQLTTINEMLFVARTDAGHLKMEKTRIELNALVRDIIDEQRSVIATRKQKYIVSTPKEPLYIDVDRQYIRMAIENIINNASKYTGTGGKIEISVLLKNSKAHLSIKDNGVGVPIGEQGMLFKKFSRIPNELTGQVSGSGIGLYLAKKVVELHSGTINFVSDGENGSEVYIKLPVKSRTFPRNKELKKQEY